MNPKKRLFVYDGREIFFLALLTLMTALFAFTLGLHLGKRVENRTYALDQKQVAFVKTTPDRVPTEQELSQEAKGTNQASEEALTRNLREEVNRTGIKLNAHHQVDLPSSTKNSKEGATTLSETHLEYALQVGSYSTLEEAKNAQAELQKHQLNPFLHEIELKGKGKWFRIYLGGYSSKTNAEEAGEKYKSQHLIQEFRVAKRQIITEDF